MYSRLADLGSRREEARPRPPHLLTSSPPRDRHAGVPQAARCGRPRPQAGRRHWRCRQQLLGRAERLPAASGRASLGQRGRGGRRGRARARTRTRTRTSATFRRRRSIRASVSSCRATGMPTWSAGSSRSPGRLAQAGQAAGNRQARVGAECMLPHACARAQEQLVLHQRQRPRHVRLMLPATCSAPCLGRCRPRAPSTVARGGAWPDSERHVRSVEGGGRGRARARRERACAENSGQACCILRGMSRQLLALTCRSAPGAVTQESGSTERWGSKPNRERAERE